MKKIFLGIILGISALLPGVCTATVAISLGIYELIIGFFSCNASSKKLNDVILLFIGFVVGFFFTSFIINSLDDSIRNKIMIFFYGFMIYGLILFYKEKINSSYKLVYFIYGFIIIILFQLIFSFLNIKFNKSITAIFIMGLLVGAALILPGLSGSMILISFNAYYYIIELIIECLKKIKISFSLLLLVSFSFGVISGIVLICLFIRKLINKNIIEFNNIIYGMLFGTIFIMTANILENININYISSFLLVLIGFLFNKFFNMVIN